jgi:hypothetical protein
MPRTTVTNGPRARITATTLTAGSHMMEASELWQEQGLPPRLMYTVAYWSRSAIVSSQTRHVHKERFDSQVDANVRAWQLLLGHVDFHTVDWVDIKRHELTLELEDVYYSMTRSRSGCLEGWREVIDKDSTGLGGEEFFRVEVRPTQTCTSDQGV